MTELEIVDPADVAIDKLRALGRPFDPAEYLTSDEEVAAYLTEALASGNKEEVASALGVRRRPKARTTPVVSRAHHATEPGT